MLNFKIYQINFRIVIAFPFIGRERWTGIKFRLEYTAVLAVCMNDFLKVAAISNSFSHVQIALRQEFLY